MGGLPVTTVAGANVVLNEAEVATLKAGIRGPLLRPGEASYEAIRHVWNGSIDRRPALSARCTGVADVIQCVQFARAHALLVSVRGGGYNIPGNVVCDGGLMIDLALMKGIRLDPTRRTIRAEGGVTWREFDHETQAFGMATTPSEPSPTLALRDSRSAAALAGSPAAMAWPVIISWLSISSPPTAAS